MTLHRGIASRYLELWADQLNTVVYAAGPGGTIDWSPLFAEFARVPGIVDENPEEELPGFEPLDDDGALGVASTVAGAVHARLNDAYQHAVDSPIDVGGALGALGGAEANYDSRLGQLHAAAAAGDHSQTVTVYMDLLADVQAVDSLLRGIGLLPVGQRRIGNLGLRCSDLARRHAMVLAGSVQVLRRMSTGPGASGMQRIAGNREVLRRHDTAQWEGVAPVSALAEGPDQVVMGEIGETGWVERPEIPYSFLRLTDGSELRVHRRDIKQNGAVPGALAWVRGKVETDGDEEKILVAQFEGPGSHASTVWEDWLADDVRDAYDLYPRVIDANWEFPPPGVQYAAGDLIARVWEV